MAPPSEKLMKQNVDSVLRHKLLDVRNTSRKFITHFIVFKTIGIGLAPVARPSYLVTQKTTVRMEKR